MGVSSTALICAALIFLRLSLSDPLPCYFSSALQLAPDQTRTKQTLLFRDARTGVPVHIIGTMHYNPHSILKTKAIIRSYGEKGRLGSVGIESCDKRWKKTQVLQPPGSIVRRLLDNEFQTAAEVGRQYIQNDFDVVLLDEGIEDNDSRVNEAFLSSVRDCFNPFGGGWTAISDDISRGYTESIDPTFFGDTDGSVSMDDTETETETESTTVLTYLDRSALFDPEMLLLAPVSLARYALAILLRKPLKGTLTLAWVVALIGLLLTREHGFPGLTFTESVLSSVGGFGLSFAVGLPLLGRVYLVALLGERNEIIAGNIRAECERLLRLVDTGASSAAATGTGTATATATRAVAEDNDAVCVVVLGLAHCNGVKRILCNSEDTKQKM